MSPGHNVPAGCALAVCLFEYMTSLPPPVECDCVLVAVRPDTPSWYVLLVCACSLACSSGWEAFCAMWSGAVFLVTMVLCSAAKIFSLRLPDELDCLHRQCRAEQRPRFLGRVVCLRGVFSGRYCTVMLHFGTLHSGLALF